MIKIPFRPGIKWAFWGTYLWAYTDLECYGLDSHNPSWNSWQSKTRHASTADYRLNQGDGVALARERGFEVEAEPKSTGKAVVSLEQQIAEMHTALRLEINRLEMRHIETDRRLANLQSRINNLTRPKI